jgi:hypothetical protein
LDPEMLKGRKAQARCVLSVFASTTMHLEGSERRSKTLRWRRSAREAVEATKVDLTQRELKTLGSAEDARTEGENASHRCSRRPVSDL